MDPITMGLLIGGGGGLIKHFAFDKPAADRKRYAESETERYSPWTGKHGEDVDDPNLGSNLMQFGTTGAMMGANVQNMENQKDFYNYFKSNTPKTPTGEINQPVVPAGSSYQSTPTIGAQNNNWQVGSNNYPMRSLPNNGMGPRYSRYGYGQSPYSFE